MASIESAREGAFSPPSFPLADPITLRELLAVKKLIRNKLTHAYLTLERTWTQDLSEAKDFTSTEAWRTRDELGLRECEVYYFFGTDSPTEYDFAVAL